MSIDAVSLQGISRLNPNIGVRSLVPESEETGFESIFQAYLSLVGETGAYQNEADKLQLEFAAGITDDMSSVLLAQEKAYASLSFTVQVTSKIIEAYREIMRMQI